MMNFTILAKRFICVSKESKTYTKIGKGSKCSKLLFKIGDRIKLVISDITQREVPILHQFTKTGLAYMDDTELATLLFQRNILLEPFDKEVLEKFVFLLMTYGWQLEAEQLEYFLKNDQLEKAVTFSIHLELYKNGWQHDMTEGELSSLLSNLNIK
ncbi:hypothetical protein [Anaerospora hongkongensis]|uniref:hypothetical protein n=1 Tax=Anaerospora hongkongensis TaxID=244830 RepID=UPI0028979BAA|nr:hypothetical protein [Anaerospora hongkongensis]